MSRSKGGFKTTRRHKKWLKLAKGFCGRRSKAYKIAHLAVLHALKYKYVGRKQLKRDMRQLWNTRINAAARINETTYSKFIHALKKSNIVLDRKILALIAVEDPNTFKTLVSTTK